jgi:hypothetical protein
MAIHICYKCMFQMFHLYQTYVAIVLFHLDVAKVNLTLHIHACCKCMFQVVCFRGMLHVFYIDVAKVDCNVVKIARCCTCCNGCTHMFQVYVPNVLSVLDICSKCFISMLQK